MSAIHEKPSPQIAAGRPPGMQMIDLGPVERGSETKERMIVLDEQWLWNCRPEETKQKHRRSHDHTPPIHKANNSRGGCLLGSVMFCGLCGGILLSLEQARLPRSVKQDFKFQPSGRPSVPRSVTRLWKKKKIIKLLLNSESEGSEY